MKSMQSTTCLEAESTENDDNDIGRFMIAHGF